MVIDYIIIYIPCKYTFSQLNYIIYISSCPNLFYIFYYPPTIFFYYSKNFLCTVLKISKHPYSFCAVRHGDASFCLLSSPQPKRTPLPIFLPVTRFSSYSHIPQFIACARPSQICVFTAKLLIGDSSLCCSQSCDRYAER